MKMNEILREGPEDGYNKLAAIGRVLMDRAVKMKDDDLSNKMASFGDALTRYGTPFGARSIQELMKKTGVSEKMVKQLMSYGEAELKKSGDAAKGDDVSDEPEDDDFGSPSDAEIDAKARAMSRG